MEKLLGHAPCFECGSSDAMACYPDHGYCFSCGKFFGFKSGKYTPPTRYVKSSYREYMKDMDIDFKTPAVGSEPTTLTDRRLSKQTLEKYLVTLRYNESGEVTEHFYPYFDKGQHTGTKVRVVEGKKFFSTGNINDSELFGQHLVPPGGKYITITEGEIDAMSVCEMTTFPAVSVKGASSALRDVKNQYEYVNSFEHIVLCFDNDAAKTKPDGTLFYPGREATEQVARLFKAGKVRIVNLAPFKDPNEFLCAGKSEAFNKAWWKAEPYQLDGIVCSSTLWDEITKEQKFFMVPYPFEGMTKKLYGMRSSEMITVTAGTGVGKTTLLKHIAVWVKDNTEPDVNIGMMMLEETLRESSLGLMSVTAKAPLHLPDCTATVEERRKAFEDTLGDGRFFFHDHFGSTSIDNIMDKIDKLVTQYDCKFVILDHISIVVSDQGNGDERRALDEIATKLKTFAINKDICLIIVCHLKRINGKPAEEGGQISISDLRGTAGIGQLSNLVLGLERDLQGETSNKVVVRCLKDRFAGRTGVVAELEFDYDNYSFNEITPSSEEPPSKFTSDEKEE